VPCPAWLAPSWGFLRQRVPAYAQKAERFVPATAWRLSDIGDNPHFHNLLIFKAILFCPVFEQTTGRQDFRGERRQPLALSTKLSTEILGKFRKRLQINDLAHSSPR
jgi:hypothetical protein